MKSPHTVRLEETLAAKRNEVLRLTEKIGDLDVRIEKASFEKKPALREEVFSLRTELDRAQAAVRKAEAPLPRSRELDAREERVAEFRRLNDLGAARAMQAREAAKTAMRLVSEAVTLGRVVAAHARALGGTPAGYTPHPTVISGIGEKFFEAMCESADALPLVRWPMLRVDVGAELPPGALGGGLVDPDETEAHRLADVELASR